MRLILVFLCMLVFNQNAFAMGSSGPGPEAVQNFEVNRYLGDWYEIGSIPQSFQRGCECTKATYSLKEESKLNVLNQCRKKGVSGPITEAKGVARFRGPTNVADLEVSFFLWFYGSYRIIALDQVNYEWSVVSNDKAETLWILSRKPIMPQTQIDRLLAVAKEQGVDTSLFQLQQQSECWD